MTAMESLMMGVQMGLCFTGILVTLGVVALIGIGTIEVVTRFDEWLSK